MHKTKMTVHEFKVTLKILNAIKKKCKPARQVLIRAVMHAIKTGDLIGSNYWLRKGGRT